MGKGWIHGSIQQDLEKLFDLIDNERSELYGQEIRLKNNGIGDFVAKDYNGNVSVFEVKTSRADLIYGKGKNWIAHYNWLVVPYELHDIAAKFIEQHKEYKNVGIILWSEYGFLVIKEAHFNPLEKCPPKPRDSKKSWLTDEWRAYEQWRLHEAWFFKCPYTNYFMWNKKWY